MKRKGKKKTREDASKERGAEVVRARWSFPRNRLMLVLRICLALFIASGIGYLYIGSDSHVLKVQPSDSPQWAFQDVTHVEWHQDDVTIRCDDVCLVVGPSLASKNISASDYPYVKVFFEEAAAPPDVFHILVSDPGHTGRLLPRPTVRKKTDLIADLRESQFWNRVLPYDALIDRVAISFRGTIRLRHIECANTLTPTEYAYLFFHALTTVEPVTGYAINGPIGVRMWGYGQVSVAIAMLLMVLLCIFAFARKKLVQKVLIGLLGVSLFLYIPLFLTLWEYVHASLRISGLKYDQWAEYESQYGKAFSLLSKELYERVPANSRVYFPRAAFPYFRMESNLVEFVHRIRYDVADISGADYIFSYHQPNAFDPVAGIFTNLEDGRKLAVAPLYRQNSDSILKVSR